MIEACFKIHLPRRLKRAPRLNHITFEVFFNLVDGYRSVKFSGFI